MKAIEVLYSSLSMTTLAGKSGIEPHLHCMYCGTHGRIRARLYCQECLPANKEYGSHNRLNGVSIYSVQNKSNIWTKKEGYAIDSAGNDHTPNATRIVREEPRAAAFKFLIENLGKFTEPYLFSVFSDKTGYSQHDFILNYPDSDVLSISGRGVEIQNRHQRFFDSVLMRELRQFALTKVEWKAVYDGYGEVENNPAKQLSVPHNSPELFLMRYAA